jgi:hypothetical protein
MRYQITMSSGSPVRIDEEEVEKIVRALRTKSIVMLKQGIVNPAHVVSVQPVLENQESNIPKSERLPDPALKDYFAAVRAPAVPAMLPGQTK